MAQQKSVLLPDVQAESCSPVLQYFQEEYVLSYKATKPVAVITNASCVAFELLRTPPLSVHLLCGFSLFC